MNILYAVILSAGIMQGGLVQYEPYEYDAVNPVFTDISADIQWGYLFFTCGIRVDMWPSEGIYFDPYQNTYQIGGGVRLGMVELGVSHSCFHPMVAYQWDGYQVTPAWEGGYNTFYGKITLSNKKKEEWVKWQW